MRYVSLFSGIEAVTQAWIRLGWECVALSEIDTFACSVLDYHYPNIPNLGDITKITEQKIKDLGEFDVIVFGSPCQNLSISGKQEGFSGEQSKLFYAAMEFINYAKKHCGVRFAMWENVLGAFSSNRGGDFAAVVEQMAGLRDVRVPSNGWGKEGCAVGCNGMLEWACLDAQWFGLAQRRKRIFAIVDFGDWAGRPPILLEQQGLRGVVAPCRGAKKDLASNIEGGANQASPNGSIKRISKSIAIQGTSIGRKPENGPQGSGFDESDLCFTLTATDRHAVQYNDIARRLTPIECERLQGFPDNFTKIPYRNKSEDDCPNGVRYKAIGNSMAVEVILWIGKKLDYVTSFNSQKNK